MTMKDFVIVDSKCKMIPEGEPAGNSEPESPGLEEKSVSDAAEDEASEIYHV
jgi:hypothetical protein